MNDQEQSRTTESPLPSNTATANRDPLSGNLSEATDDELMISLQGGESAAFDELVHRYQGQLLGFFFRNTRDRQFSEDLTQETLLRAYSQSWDYLPVGKFRGWLYRVARNLLIDNVRKQAHDAILLAFRGESKDDALSKLAGEVLSPMSGASEREISELVEEMLELIPEEQRLCFILHHFCDLPLPEVAEILECGHATCKSRLRLAREKLQELLRARGIGEVA